MTIRMDRIRLENFALIKSGMGLDEIDIDFTKSKYTVSLIIGNNGTGKTALLSNFHPFPYLGALEAREDADIIIPDMDGHKEVWYSKGDDRYYIEHIYLAPAGKRTTRQVKCYIQKNGKELNEPGTVKTFNEIVESEFQIEPNFLKLIRLGPNVQNFIKLSFTDRKFFISKLLSEVEDYMKDYKQAKEQAKFLANALKLAVSKRDKLNISDISILDTGIARKEEMIKSRYDDKESLTKRFYEYKGSINLDSMETLQTLYDVTLQNIENLKDTIKNLDKPKYLHVSTSSATTAEYTDKLVNLNLSHSGIVSQRAIILNEKQRVIDLLEAENKKLEATKASSELEEIQGYIKELTEKIDAFEKSFDISQHDTSISKDVFMSYVDTINIIIYQMKDVFELPETGLQYFRDIYVDNMVQPNTIDKIEAKLRRDVSELLVQLDRTVSNSKQHRKIADKMRTPEGCELFNECPYYLHYHDELVHHAKEDTIKLEFDIDCRNEALTVFNQLKSIQMLLNTIKLEHRMDHDYQGIIASIMKRDINEFVDYEAVKSEVEFLEYYEEYVNHKDKRAEYEQQAKVFQLSNQLESPDEILSNISKLTMQLSVFNKQIDELDRKESERLEEIEQTKDLIDDFSRYVEYTNEVERLNTELTHTKESRDTLKDSLKEKIEYDEKLAIYNKQVEAIEFDISSLEDSIYHDRVKRTQFIELGQEIEQIKTRYDIVELLKEAVSTNKGIPLIYINSYFKSLRLVANEIIKDIYENDFVLEEFVVNDKEFRIPYRTKGVSVRDIRYASQAESSVATLAISFAMLEQFAYTYNIILLDEVDGPMYKGNKERFFAALEGMLSRIHSEQAFIITQSTMFNDYPVNLIITDPSYRSLYEDNMNVIFQR
jgi:hypothetical protein|nr:MAG TPA: endonuclease subunit [Caudoviricetes sp.]